MAFGSLRTVLAFTIAASGCGSSTSPASISPSLQTEASKPCASLDECRAACTKAAGPAAFEPCSTARRLAKEQPLDVSVEQLRDLLTAGCDAGDATSCREAALLITQSPVLTPDPERARKLYDQACRAGDAPSCLNAVPAVIEGDVAALAAVLAKVEAACEADDAISCGLASALFAGPGQDPIKFRRYGARAGQLFEEDCLAGQANSCFQGALHIGSMQLDVSPRAQRMLTTGCDLGDHAACTLLVQQSPAMPDSERMELLARACKGGRQDACLLFGAARHARGESDGVAQIARAVALSTARCRQGDVIACDTLAEATIAWSEASNGAPEAHQAAGASIDLLGIVCERGTAVTCFQLGKALESLPEPLGDAARARSLTERACELGYPFACVDPMAQLGFATRLTLPIVDWPAKLMWAPQPVRDVLPHRAEAVCNSLNQAELDDWRLPTKTELMRLAEGRFATVAKLSFPHEGAYFSAETEPDGSRIAFDLERGALVSDRTEGYAHCVRSAPDVVPPRLTLRMEGENLAYAARDPADKIIDAGTIVRAADAQQWAGTVDASRVKEAVVAQVDSSMDWALAARFLGTAIRDGLRLRYIVVE